MYFSTPSIHWLEALLEERFGSTFTIDQAPSELTLSLLGAHGVIIFDTLQPHFHRSNSYFCCHHWQASSEGFSGPVEDEIPAPSEGEFQIPVMEQKGRDFTIHYDILGLTFWMLTRLEEIGCEDLDDHQRFPATFSHAFKNGYLERPIVDEWLAILGQVIQRVWPQVELKEHSFQVKVSHDVDEPARYAFQNPGRLIRTMGGDLLLRKDFKAALTGPWIWLNSRMDIHPGDPANTFDWLMEQSEEHGLSSAFYFICGRTDSAKDASYDPEMPQIRSLMRKIHSRGHEIGLHPSYNTFNNPEEIRKEAERLKNVCSEEGIRQPAWGGRMHYLRWDQALTLKAWADAGMAYDSTLGYADRPGFRCGTCFEYPAFDITTDQCLPLRIRPLVAMDCTVMARRYLGLGSTEAAFLKFQELKNKCRAVGGVFTLLWHNSSFNAAEDFYIYRRLLSNDRLNLQTSSCFNESPYARS
jgi:hypothetical protein